MTTRKRRQRVSGVGALLTLPEPPSANRWWRNFRGRMVKSKEARDYQDTIKNKLVSEGLFGLIPKPTSVTVSITWFRGRKSGDLDKRLGVLLDALQGICYDNDSQVTELFARRFDDKDRPRVEVLVVAMPTPMLKRRQRAHALTK